MWEIQSWYVEDSVLYLKESFDDYSLDGAWNLWLFVLLVAYLLLCWNVDSFWNFSKGIMIDINITKKGCLDSIFAMFLGAIMTFQSSRFWIIDIHIDWVEDIKYRWRHSLCHQIQLSTLRCRFRNFLYIFYIICCTIDRIIAWILKWTSYILNFFKILKQKKCITYSFKILLWKTKYSLDYTFQISSIIQKFSKPWRKWRTEAVSERKNLKWDNFMNLL